MLPRDHQSLGQEKEKSRENPSGFICQVAKWQAAWFATAIWVWCSDCSNSCCNVIISGRMCLLRAILLIPAAEDREQQGSRWGGKDFRALGSLRHSNSSTGFTQLYWVGQSATWCSGKCFSFLPIRKNISISLVVFLHGLICGWFKGFK